MDPALQELLLPELDPDEMLEVLVRLRKPGLFPPKTGVVSQFGEIVSCRIRRSDIAEVYAHEAVRSMKAARVVGVKGLGEEPADLHESTSDFDEAVTGIGATGRGVVIAILDWGCDFAHHDFVRPDGTSRFLSIWYQHPKPNPKSPRPFQYGVEYTHAQINAALAAAKPYEKLGYHPGLAKSDGGAHGTLVAGIAAGGGAGHRGVAPEADLVFVHLSTHNDPALNLGDTVRILEALDYVRRVAGNRPLVVNMSLGAHGGSHDGQSLIELGMDYFLKLRPNTMICQSVGNYYDKRAHCTNVVLPGKSAQFTFRVQAGDPSDNELEVWYNGHDVLVPTLFHEQTELQVRCDLDQSAEIKVQGQVVGRLYHRSLDPNNGKNHINLFLYKQAPAGRWQMHFEGQQVLDGRFDAWIERDNGGFQAKFEDEFVARRTTNGTICNGLYPIVVGAVDRQNKPPIFSSSGPTTDGRRKPDIVAPGTDVRGAKSAPLKAEQGNAQVMYDQGTSMAAPKVAGTVALMLEKAAKPVDVFTLRTLLLAAAHPLTNLSPDGIERTGSGLLDPRAAVDAMKHYQLKLKMPMQNQENWPFRQTGDAGETLNPSSAGKVFLAPNDLGRSLPILPNSRRTFPTLDGALKAALQAGFGNSFIIRGSLFSGGPFEVLSLHLPFSPVTPWVIRLQAASPDICCLVLDGTAPYFPSNITQPGERWVQFPDSEEFYLQTDQTRYEQRKRWAGKIVGNLSKISLPGVHLTDALVRKLSAPEMRLLLANFADLFYKIGRVKGGGVMNGATLAPFTIPLREPECYIRVISKAEGQLESINAWDTGAGISLGPIQFNVQRGNIFKFLWKIWQEDKVLFDKAFSPLGWTMASNANGIPVLNGLTKQGKPFQLIGLSKDEPASTPHWNRAIRYFHSGDPDNKSIDIEFRVMLAERFRQLVAWPHIQSLILKISSDYFNPSLQTIKASGIKPLDTNQPDRDAFVLKAVLASAYVRASGCGTTLIKRLSKYSTLAEKLENLQHEVANLPKMGGFDCAEALSGRLIEQLKTANEVFDRIEQTIRSKSPASPPITPPPSEPRPTTETVVSSANSLEDNFIWMDGSIWAEWSHESTGAESADCNCESAGENWSANESDALLEAITSDSNDNIESDFNPESSAWASWHMN